MRVLIKGEFPILDHLGSEKWEPSWTPPNIRIILVKRVLIKRETCRRKSATIYGICPSSKQDRNEIDANCLVRSLFPYKSWVMSTNTVFRQASSVYWRDLGLLAFYTPGWWSVANNNAINRPVVKLKGRSPCSGQCHLKLGIMNYYDDNSTWWPQGAWVVEYKSYQGWRDHALPGEKVHTRKEMKHQQNRTCDHQ